MGEERGDSLATRALDVHVERVWALNSALKLVSLGLLRGGWVEDIFSESHGLVLFCDGFGEEKRKGEDETTRRMKKKTAVVRH